MATVTPASFRTAFPAFADPVKYPDGEIQFWIDTAYLLHDPARWGNLLEIGISLFVAHNLALDGSATSASGGGGIPGGIVGPISSASVDKVSYSRNPMIAFEKDAGHWNLTTWGSRWYRLMRMVGAGPIQVDVPPGNSNYGYNGAWPGVIFPPANE